MPGFIRDNPFKINDKQMAFLNEYLVDYNVRRAARVLGMNERECWSWKESKNFQMTLDAYFEQLRRERKVLVDATLEELKTVMTSDIKDFVEWGENGIKIKNSADIKNSKAIKSIKETQNGLQITLHDKVKGIELMMAGLGMLKRPSEDKPMDAEVPQDENAGGKLLEALEKAHAERRNAPKITDGLVRVEQSKEDEQ